jgi:putative flavoprotein involved in K+ transport
LTAARLEKKALVVKQVTTVIIGAGQSGLAMSRQLSIRGIDHVVLDRGEVANSWRNERWNSLRLLTPNWQARLPGHVYSGSDPEGYMTMPEVISYLQTYADRISAPVETGTTVMHVSRSGDGYMVATDRDTWRCHILVIASGACNVPIVPALSAQLPARIVNLTPFQYRAPDQLPDGGVMVVGASATGVQLAHEIRASGRDVVLCVGEHVRLPRVYRGRDITWWMDAAGMMDVRYDEIEDIERARRLPSMQLIGTPERTTIDLNSLRAIGVEVVGRLVAVDGSKARFSGSLPNCCTLADLKMNRLLESIDSWIVAQGMAERVDPQDRYEPTRLAPNSPLMLDLDARGIRAVIWATGFRPDYSWLDVPVLDRKGRLRHAGGVVASPGMYVIGLPFMRRRKSSFIDGAGDDAADLAAHMHSYLARAAA